MVRVSIDEANAVGLEMERLVYTYSDELLRVCFMMLGERTLAEDSLQDSFIKAYLNYGKFRGGCSERTWLTRIVINTCRNYRRTHWFKTRKSQVTFENIPDSMCEWCAPDDSISVAIMDLPDNIRESVLLRYYQGFTVEEAALILNISTSALYARLATAKKLIRRLLDVVEP